MPVLIEHIDALARKNGRAVRYLALRDYLEHPDGTKRHAGVRFYAMPIEHAMENAAHDEPGFRERRVEDF